MSTTIDQKVVELRFDNRDFEKNTRETMSTLDKLKQKLNLSGASKGFDNINASANKVNMNGLSGALTTVQDKFSVLEVVGITALANITNSAVEAGKRMVKALTVDPVMDGWKEYEMTLNAVQTTMAGTGKTAEEVEKELKKLDEYADKTVYSTADMLNNLPKFTNAGVKLEEATTAMIGIANATALAGGDASKASIAFYNLGQAIGTGYLTRMDYNSINNAGIATMEWKEQMVEAAIAAGTLKKAGNGLYQAGKKTFTIQQLFIDGLQEQWATTDVMMKVFRDYGDETTEIGKKSYSAAQDIKTFSMMMDSLKATAGTGWKDTWQIIFGGLEPAKKFWTGLTNFISGIITGITKFRNNLLSGGLLTKLNPFGDLFDKIKKSGIAKEVTGITRSLDEYQKMVNKIWRGDYKNQPYRFDLLRKAGWDPYVLQALVNKGYKYKLTVEDVAKAEKKYGKQLKENRTIEKLSVDDRNKLLKQLAAMSDAELKAAGYEEQIDALRQLRKYCDMTGLSIGEFIDNLDDLDGRWLLINSFKNIGQGLVSVFNAIKDAWVETVGVLKPEHLFKVIAAFHKFTTYLKVSDREAENLKDTFKGLFAIFDIVLTIIGGPIKIALKLLGQLFKALDIGFGGVLEFTGAIGRAISGFHDWLEEVFDFTAVFEYLVPYIKLAASAIKDWFKGLKNSEAIKKFTKYLAGAKDAVVDWFKGLKDADNIAKYIFEGLVNGLKKGAKGVIDFVMEIGTKILEGIKKILGIHSPSKEFYEIGKNIIQGLFNGISDFVKMVYTLVMSIGSKIIDVIKRLDIGSIFTIVAGGSFIYGFVKIANAIETLTSPLEEVDGLVKQFKKTVKAFKGVLNAAKMRLYAESIKTLAVAVAILAGSVAVLSLLDQNSLKSSVKAILALVVALGVLTFVAGKFGGGESISFGKIALTMIGLGIAIAIMAKAMKTLGTLNTDQFAQAFEGVIIIMGSMIAMMAVVSRESASFASVGSAFTGVAFALLMMLAVAKIAGKSDVDQLKQGYQVIVAFGLIVAGLMAATRLMGDSKSIDNIGKTIFKISSAILMMLVVAKIAGSMNPSDLRQGFLAVFGFGLIIAGLMAATRLIASKDIHSAMSISKIGKAILGVGGALLMMAIAAKIAGSMKIGDIAKGVIAVGMFSGMVAALILVTHFADTEIDKLGKTMLMISVAIGVLAISAALLGMIDTTNLAKGVIAVGFLSGMVAGLIAVTKLAQNVMGTVIAITVALGLLVISVGLLSMVDPTKLAGATLAVMGVLGMFAVVIAASKLATGAMGTLIVLTVAIGLLSLALYQLAQLPVKQSLGAAGALSLLLMALSGALLILSVVGTFGPAGLIGVGILAAFIVAMGALVIAIGWLMKKIPELQEFLNTGIGVLKQLAGGIGEVIGAFIGGMLTQISSSLPEIATNLSLFMTNLTPFINGAKAIDMDVLAGVGIIAGALLILTAADFLSGVMTWLSGGPSFAELGSELSNFMINAMPFIMLSKQVNPAIMTGIKSLAEAVLILTGTDILDSLTSWFTGGNSLENFGTQLAGLATSLKGFVNNLGTFTSEQVATVTCACDAIKALAAAADTIPNEGGLWAKIAGDNSLATFGSKLPGLGTHLNQFITNLGTFGNDSVNSVNCACQAITSLANAASSIPNEGGLWASIVGDNSIATFGSKLPGLATHLNQFTTNLGSFSEDSINTVNCAGEAIKALASAAGSIPNEGGLWASIFGDNSLATFGEKLPGLATNIAGFVNNLGTFTSEQVSTVTSACDAIRAIANLGKIDIDDVSDGLNSLGKKMVKFAKKIREFVDELSEVGSDGISSAIQKTQDLINMASTVASVDIRSLETFGKSLKKVAKDGVNGFVDELSGESPKADAEDAAGDLLDAVIKGAERKKSDVKKKFKAVAEAGIENLAPTTLITSAASAGKDLVQGFVNGIINNKYLATNAGSSLGKAALDAAKKAIDSNSPSKEAMKIGNYFGQGLVIGINDYESKTYDAGFGIADRAKSGLSKAISKISNLISNGVDTQPTIRPVLDLSDVENGTSLLNSMFNDGPSIGVMSNLNAIGNRINKQNQNGRNDDVVSAINKLRNDLGNVGGNTYNVNGVTYSDENNITNAVKDLIRAIQMEGRM